MIFLLTSLAFADDGVVAVLGGETKPITGPSVCMTEVRFTQFLKAERSLPICQTALEEAAEASIEADRRAISAYDVVSRQFAGDAKLISDLQMQVAKSADETVRLRNQRNTAWGIVAGLVAGGVTATVLAVTN